jgi:hypothetical protein
MNGHEKSDPGIVAVKPANKAERSVAESGERRAGAEGNAEQVDTLRTPSQKGASQSLDRVRRTVTPVRRYSRGGSRGKAARTVLCGRRAVMRVLTTIAKKKHTVITLIVLDKLRFEKQKLRPRFIHQGRPKAGAELAMTGSADGNPIHRSGSAHFFTRSLSCRRAQRRCQNKK